MTNKSAPDPRLIEYEGDITFQEVWRVLRNWRGAAPWMHRKTFALLVPLGCWVLTVIALIAHIVWYAHSNCATDFARVGAAVTMIAAVGAAVMDWNADTGAYLSGKPREKLRFLQPVVTLATLVLIGTFIWGYGDQFFFLTRSGCR